MGTLESSGNNMSHNIGSIDLVGKNLTERPEKQTGLVFYIVGNMYSEFCDNNIVVECSEALKHTRIIASLARRVVFCQGLSIQDVSAIKQAIDSHTGNERIGFVDFSCEKINKKLVGKEDDSNVLITYPKMINEREFSSELVIDGRYAELGALPGSDYIQGGVLVEAARQIFLASVKAYRFSVNQSVSPDELQFMLRNITITFQNFVFPLRVDLNLQITDIKYKNKSAFGAAIVKVMQFNRICCEVRFEASACTIDVLDNLKKISINRARNKISFEH